MNRFLTILIVANILAGCRAKDGDWEEIENYGESALYLDTSSIEKSGELSTFRTKLATPGWRAIFTEGEIRDTRQIDCKAKTLRTLDGGIYVDGRLKYPHVKLGSGKIGAKGYGKLLYDRVC